MIKNSLIEELYKQFSGIEKTIKRRPTLGSENWILVEVILYSENVFGLKLEDGHNYHDVKLKYVEKENRFEILEE